MSDMNCENVLRPFGNIVNFALGQDNYEKFAMAWFHFKMKKNFTNENIKYLEKVIHDGVLCVVFHFVLFVVCFCCYSLIVK